MYLLFSVFTYKNGYKTHKNVHLMFTSEKSENNFKYLFFIDLIMLASKSNINFI